ncbi:MAG: pyrroline-5-carboxylate reductase [Bacteroidales bacterium]|jgi:pyrroline-5-carboxylate reductase|nr:pyrroline-5-carboxylate reductase [Bacteroidales bacterium]
MNTKRIAIIGVGNLGSAIARGIASSGRFRAKDIALSVHNEKNRDILGKEGFDVFFDNKKAAAENDLLILAVKPYQTDVLLEEIKHQVESKNPVIVSCITGISSEYIYERLGCRPALFRVMPNTGIGIGESMSCISAHNADDSACKFVNDLFEALGKVLFISEDMMPAATALAGCGIAYALRFIRAATEAGVEIGFKASDAKKIAAQITKGAAQLILSNNSNPEEEIDKVTTPKGITIRGLNEMEHSGFSSAVIKGITESFEKTSK